jgi:hypothetical protein
MIVASSPIVDSVDIVVRCIADVGALTLISFTVIAVGLFMVFEDADVSI